MASEKYSNNKYCQGEFDQLMHADVYVNWPLSLSEMGRI